MEMISDTKIEIINRLNIESFYASELPTLKLYSSEQAQALCPFHHDTHPSFSVNLAKGNFNCFGCKACGSIFDFYMLKYGVDFPTAIKALAERAGIETRSPKRNFSKPASSYRQIIKTYDYTDETGNLLFQVIRYLPKGFSQRRPDGRGGWIRNVQGVRLVPYKLSTILGAKQVFVVEGEEDADNLDVLDLSATTNPMGVGKWKNDYAQYFGGKKVVIIPDNDKLGRDHALQVAESLKGVAESVKVVHLPGLPEKGDVSDWIERKRATGISDKQIKKLLQTIATGKDGG